MRAALTATLALLGSACATYRPPRVPLAQMLAAGAPAPVEAPQTIEPRHLAPRELDSMLDAFVAQGAQLRALRLPGVPMGPVRERAWQDVIAASEGLLDVPEESASINRAVRAESILEAELGRDERTYHGLPAALVAAARGCEQALATRVDHLRAREEALRRMMPRFIWPVYPALITSRFGRRLHPILGVVRMHDGVDLRASPGQLVVASAAGRVTRALWDGGYGRMVEIEHPDGSRTRYAHLARILVSRFEKVAQGAPIGLAGSSGLATGVNVHFEVWLRGRPRNPLRLVGRPPRRPGRTPLVSRQEGGSLQVAIPGRPSS